jgi:hypothetical protein
MCLLQAVSIPKYLFKVIINLNDFIIMFGILIASLLQLDQAGRKQQGMTAWVGE